MEGKPVMQNQQGVIEKGKNINGEIKGKKSKKTILISVLIVVVLLAASIGLYLYSDSLRYFTTDNAKVTAKMYYITPGLSGKLLEWSAQEGERVAKDQILGREEVLPYITSPIAGTVVENNGVQGEMVTPASQLAVVADTDNLYIGVNIEETNIIKIQVGQSVDVQIDAYPGRTFKGVVSEVDRTTQTYFSNPTSFSTSGTYTKVTQLIPVKVIIQNENNLPLTFGMNATVKIRLGNTSSNGATAKSQGAASGAPVKQEVEYTSNIEAGDQMAVSPDVSGKVSKVNVEVGQSVNKGDVLFELDSTNLALQVQQATAGYNAAVSAYNNSQEAYDSKSNVVPAQEAYNSALADFGREKALYDAGAVSKVDLDNAQAKVDSAQAQLQTAQHSAQTALDAARGQMESAKAALDILQNELDYCVIKAPMSGAIASKNISIGDMASPQAPAVSLINAQNVKVQINVTETNIAKVKIGMKAGVNVQAIGDSRQGTVESVAPACDPKTGTFPVEILLDNSDGKLKPGMLADVTLQLE